MISNKVLEQEFESRKRFGVRTPFIYDLVEEIRTIEGRVWHKEKKFWSFPTKKFEEVVNVLDKYTPQLAQSMRTKDSWAPYRKKAELIRRRELLNLKKSKKTESEIDVPCNKGLAYDSFQLAGIEYSVNKKASLNADEPGLGKTIQALGIMNMKQTTRNVVICPNNVKVNWSREAKKWLVNKDIEVIVLYSNSHLETQRRKDNFLYIINYDILKKIVGEKGFFSKIPLDLVVLDEAHMAKNPKAQRTKFAYHLANKAEQKLFLTGTPILNKVDEIYPLLNNLRPDIWSNKWQFKNKFLQYVEDGYGKKYVGGKNLDILQESLRANVMIRRLKQDVLKDLPPKRRQIIEIPVSSRHKAAMQAEKKVDKRHLKALLKDLSDKGYNEKVMEKSVGKMQFIKHVSKVRHDTAVAKVPDVIEFVDNLLESVDKVILFAHHRDVLHALNSHYGDLSVLLMGGMTPKKKQAAVDRFQEDPDVKVFVGGIIPAGVGLTLTAASTVVFAELDWVPGNLSQAEDRCHRKGQTDNVMVYHIVLENSIDYYLAETNLEKQAVIDKSLNNG